MVLGLPLWSRTTGPIQWQQVPAGAALSATGATAIPGAGGRPAVQNPGAGWLLQLFQSLLLQQLSSNSGGQDAVEVGFSAYADDIVCWAAGRSSELVGGKLAKISAVLVA